MSTETQEKQAFQQMDNLVIRTFVSLRDMQHLDAVLIAPMLLEFDATIETYGYKQLATPQPHKSTRITPRGRIVRETRIKAVGGIIIQLEVLAGPHYKGKFDGE